MRELPEGWTRNEDELAAPPGRTVSYVGRDDDQWVGAITHQRNRVVVSADDMSVSLDLRIRSGAELHAVLDMLERAWAERHDLVPRPVPTAKPTRQVRQRIPG